MGNLLLKFKVDRIFLGCLAILIFMAAVILLGSPLARAAVPAIEGASYVLLSGDTGQVLEAKNADLKWYPASTTKIMTLVLALEAVADGSHSFDETVTASANAAGMGGSQVYLKDGEQRSLHEMLIAIAVGSGNDAAVAVAEHLGGTVESFVEQMNAKAQQLGMMGTHYTNPHGLHDANHYTTAGDMAKLALYAISVPKMLEYTSIYEYDFRPEPKPLKLWNTNRMLKWYPGTDGLKTGYTEQAKRNLVSTVVRDDMRLVAVVLGVAPANGHFAESMKLYNYGFSQFAYSKAFLKGEVICTVPVLKGEKNQVEAVAAENGGILSKKGEKGQVSTSVDVSVFPQAPLKCGDKIGEVSLLRDGQEVSRVALLAAADVPKIKFLAYWQQNMQQIIAFA